MDPKLALSIRVPLPSHLSGLQIWLLRHGPVAAAGLPSYPTILQASISLIGATSWRVDMDATRAPSLQQSLPPPRLYCPSPCSVPMARKRRKGRPTTTDSHSVRVCPVHPTQPFRHLYQAKSPSGTPLSSLIPRRSNPIQSKANNGIRRHRHGDDVWDTALLEPSKQPKSVTFSVKVSLVQMLHSVVIMDVVTLEQACIVDS
jgi:hypothetical protein